MMKRIAISTCACGLLLMHGVARAQASPAGPPQVDIQRTEPAQQRIPQQKAATLAALQGMVLDEAGRPVPAVEVKLEGPIGAAGAGVVATSGDGIFRLLRVPPGTYDLILTRKGGAPLRRPAVELRPGEVLSIEVKLPVVDLSLGPALTQAPMEVIDDAGYREISRRPDADGAVVAPKEEDVAPESARFSTERDRWGVPMPQYHRYDQGEVPFIMGRWFDPFNRNQLKGDRPLFGKTFFSFTGDSITAIEGRRLPLPAGQSTANPNEDHFIGRGGQMFYAQTFRMTFDLFHGDTASFRPVDWRVKITPAANITYLDARENQVVSPDVRQGTTRLDGHVGLQEAFVEVKLHDFGPNYDFMNIRFGIQQFTSDFRGFIFADENLAVRLFGNLYSNRVQYNLIGFDLLEKDTNSGLNTFHRRGREVAIGNIFIQDAIFKGYTTQFSYHFVRDNASTHYDNNGFLVRPAPIGTVRPHNIDAHYAGWTGDGHIGRTNITHAAYQVFGHDQHEPLADMVGRLNAQFAAMELSRDRDWLRFRISGLFSSGDNNPRDRISRGFSSIVDGVGFAGGEFSFFNREGIPFTRAGVSLKSPDSFLPDLRTGKDQGQSNFVNPGLYLYNAGVDADLTPTLKLVGNVNFLQFARTQSLVFLTQQDKIARTVGVDAGLGAIYRPFLSDNIVIHAGATVLAPGKGLRQIYSSQTLFSAFVLVKFQF